jgi:hypothetical protein
MSLARRSNANSASNISGGFCESYAIASIAPPLRSSAHLVLLEAERDRRVAGDGALALEVADAVFVEHDASDRQRGGIGGDEGLRGGERESGDEEFRIRHDQRTT